MHAKQLNLTYHQPNHLSLLLLTHTPSARLRITKDVDTVYDHLHVATLLKYHEQLPKNMKLQLLLYGGAQIPLVGNFYEACSCLLQYDPIFINPHLPFKHFLQRCRHLRICCSERFWIKGGSVYNIGFYLSISSLYNSMSKGKSEFWSLFMCLRD